MKKTVARLLVFTMLLTLFAAAPVSIGAEPSAAGTVVLAEDDFSGSTLDAAWNVVSDGKVTIEDGAAKMTGGAGSPEGFGIKPDAAIADGTVEISFDIYVPAANKTAKDNVFEFLVTGKESHTSSANDIMTLKKEGQWLGNTGIGKHYAFDTWYTWKNTFDVTTGEVTSVMIDRETAEEVYSGTITNSRFAGPHQEIYFGTKYMNDGEYFLLDNVSIKHTPAPSYHLPVEDTFEGAEIDGAKWNLVNTTNVTVEDGAAKLYGGGGTLVGFGIQPEQPVTEGTVEIKLDIFAPAANESGFEFMINGGNGSHNSEGKDILGFKKDGFYLGTHNVLGKDGFSYDTWYTWTTTFDVTTGTVSTWIVNRDTKEELVNPETVPASENGRFVGPHNAFYLGTKWIVDTEKYVLVDNLSIKTEASEEPEEPVYQLPVSDDFSGGTIDTNKWNVIDADKVTVEDGAAKLYGGEHSAAGFGVKLDETIDTGRIELSFDIYVPGSNTDVDAVYEFLITGKESNSDTSAILSINANNQSLGTTGLGQKYTVDEWYTWKNTFDVTTGQVWSLMTKKSDGSVVYDTADNVLTNDRFEGPHSQFFFGTKYMNGNQYFLVDNISIKMAESEEPEEPVYQLPVSDDFGGGSIDTGKWNLVDTAYVTVEDGAAKLFGGGGDIKGFGIKPEQPVTEGTVEIKLDVYAPAVNESGFELSITGKDTHTGNEKDILTFGKNDFGHGFSLGTRFRDGSTYAYDTWYTWTTTFDVTTGTASMQIVNRGTQEELVNLANIPASETGSRFIGPHQEFFFGSKWISGDPDKYILIDNLSIKTEASQEPEKPEISLPVTDNFDGAAFDFEKWNTSSQNNVALEGGAAKVFGGGGSAMGFGVQLGEPVSSGEVNMKFDVKIPSVNKGTWELMVYYGMPEDDYAICNISGGGVNIGTDPKFTGGGLTPEKWYAIDLTFDVEEGLGTISVLSKEDAGAVPKTYSMSNPHDRLKGARDQFYFGTKWMNVDDGEKDAGAPQEHVLIDNVSITRVYEAPSISSVTFVKYDDTESTSVVSVPAGTKRIDVKFNTSMDASTLSQDTMQLLKGAEKVAYTGSYDDAALTWSIALPNYLEPAVTYTLNMTADVKNGAGTAVAPATREFLTDAGEFKVSLTAWKGDTQVTELSQLSDGDSITVKAQVVNTAGKAQDLLIIYAGYNGQLMTAYQGAERQIAADERNKLIDDIAISVDTDLLSAIRIFGWDNYDSLQPLAIPCEIK